MSRPGFIHDKLDIKLLVLYIMSRVVAPIEFATLTDLVLCDDGIDYFDYAECVAELGSRDRKSTRLYTSHMYQARMPYSA